MLKHRKIDRNFLPCRGKAVDCHPIDLSRGVRDMALRAAPKVRSKDEAIEATPEPASQRTRTEERYRLQVDRQTKRSYATLEAAEEAGAAIKIAHKIVQVSIYDAIDCTNTLIGDDGKPVPVPAKAE
jgi:hypothetical protein